MANVIKQIVKGSGDSQSIKMIVKDNERGPQGEQGEPGVAATVSVGQTSTLPAGSAATVQNTGSSSAAVLAFGIPKGDKGEDGVAASVAIGSTTTLPAGYPAMVQNSGTSSAAILDFSIPQGVQGMQGPRGEKGDTGATGAPGKDGIDGKDGKDGKDGAIHYTAGTGIQITDSNVINATGAAVATWGGIQGTLSNQTDLQNALNAKQDTLTAGTNISINGDTISAVDTTYSAFIGTDGSDAGTLGLVPAPATTDAGKYLNASGAWSTVSIPTVNDSTITITNNGSTIDSFTTNAASNKTIALAAPVITMTSTDPGEGSALAANNYVAVYGGDPIIMDYSTIETNTGSTWIDGSAIYKKTLNVPALPDSTTLSIAHNISNLGTVINIEGTCHDSSGYQLLMNSPRTSTTDANFIRTIIHGIYVDIITGTDRSSYSGYVTLYYTKSS